MGTGFDFELSNNDHFSGGNLKVSLASNIMSIEILKLEQETGAIMYVHSIFDVFPQINYVLHSGSIVRMYDGSNVWR